MSEVGARARSLRQALGWSQERLAVEAKLSRSAIQSYELLRRSPGSAELGRLAVALGVPADCLLGLCTHDHEDQPAQVRPTGTGS